jgi:hypothetical protein
VAEDVTVYNEQGLVTKPLGKLRWGLAAALVLVLSGAGGVYAMLDRLPNGYLDGGGEVGILGAEQTPEALPEVRPMPALEIVNIRIDSLPRGAGVYLGEDRLGETLYLAARLKDPSGKLTLQLRMPGHAKANIVVSLDEDSDELISLKPFGVTVLKDPPPRPVAKPAAKPVVAKPRPIKKPKKKIKPPAVVKKPTPPAAVVKKPTKKKKKSNPFGGSVTDVKE